MPIFTCPECQHPQLSTLADYCPVCNAPVAAMQQQQRSGSSVRSGDSVVSLKAKVEQCCHFVLKPKVGKSDYYPESSISINGLNELRVCAQHLATDVEAILFNPEIYSEGEPRCDASSWTEVIRELQKFPSLKELHLCRPILCDRKPEKLMLLDDETLLLISRLRTLRVISLFMLDGSRLSLASLLRLKELPELELVTLPLLLTRGRNAALDSYEIKNQLKKFLPSVVIK